MMEDRGDRENRNSKPDLQDPGSVPAQDFIRAIVTEGEKAALALNPATHFSKMCRIAGRSSNGRTGGSGPSNRGSNPCLPAII